ncbi:MAG TPA: hypothetical protein PK842_05985 [Smithella sp.]|jgi:uncharacterized membrane protein|nr:hypothetical protein [Smithella sp.]OPZ50860.1 MAG: hypothetical protein BWY90_01531 [Deltaproteobacteria bacterium ADurb.BinA014]HNQ66105.1 hypothetical protein [Smithella sp.]HOG09272.1 hypothetical protein [Smithella sp.]HOS13023.1 hypothetical protein [Smithella sp.]
MMHSSTTASGTTLYRRMAEVFFLLIVFPFVLSLINLEFAQQWKVHFFPAAIILAALIFGATGGLAAGVAGSLYSAFLLGNPYLIIGNAALGFFTGLFYQKTDNLILSVILAFICQLPWLVVSDYYLMHLSEAFILKLVVVLFLADILWAVLISAINKPLRKLLC